MTDEPRPRFLTPTQVAEELNVKTNQVHVLIKTGELKAIHVGGRGMWRIGWKDLEDYIDEAYRRAAERIAAGELEESTSEEGDQE